jgi:hypothetical protein
MIKVFAIPRPNREATHEEHKAWAYMQQQLEFKRFTPALTDFAGDTDNILARGYFQLLGPVVYIKILLKNTEGSSFGWAAGATISLPFAPFVATDGTLFPQFVEPIIEVDTALAVNNECPRVKTNGVGKGILELNTALSDTGGPIEVAISGFYIRTGHDRPYIDEPPV